MVKKIAAAVAVLAALVVAFQYYDSTSGPVFRRLVADPIPDSVSDIRIYGYTALAGSDQAVTFEVSAGDLAEILSSQKFRLLQGEEATSALGGPGWQEAGISDPVVYRRVERNGMLVFTLVTNKAGDRAYFRYLKI